ncbi:MAG: serine/threonine protein kinase [Acidobacteria bacterium]|nr:serine/threonine protein kinase [Acidobacteriota bacterium]
MIRCVRCSTEMSALIVFCPRCQHPNEPDFKQLMRQTLSQRFQLYRQLGEGGLSTVFAAIDLQTDKTVVVKVSDPRHLTQTNFNSEAERLEARQYWSEMTERMQREVTALANVQHPNIVKVLAAGTISADLSYVVMELLRGKTLREELNVRGRLPINEALTVAAEVAKGLSIIHAQGIVHRDLTPRNIFLCELNEERQKDRGEERQREPASIPASPCRNVKLIDFGIAKLPKPPGAQTYTQHAVMAGTPGYASPEQFQNLAVDHRADIYSLGVMLYEMVTGEKPFSGRSATEIALKQIRDEPIRPRVLVPDLPIRLEALILRALAKDPTVRQQTADELAAELKTISARIEVPLFVPLPTLPTAEPEPSGAEVFTLLSDLAAKAEATPAPPPTPLPEKLEVTKIPELPELQLELPPPRRHRTILVAAALALLFVLATWLFARQNPSLPTFSQASLSPTPATFSTPAPTPTLRPDITTPKTASYAPTTRDQQGENNALLEKATVVARPQPTPQLIAATNPAAKVSRNPTPTPAPRPRVTPAPQIATSRVPPVVTPQPPARVEPTPSPAPPPVRNDPRDTIAVDSDGWKREPAPPARPERTTPSPHETVVPDPKVIPWQGRVYGSREITLEMPGVPGMVDIPRNFRKKVGVVEPPSPSNGWRRAVFRVFGNGDVSLIIRWWPHRTAQFTKQEIANWTSFR